MLTDNDLYYLRSILGQLREVRKVVLRESEGASLVGEVLADNIDWLDCFIDKHQRERDNERKGEPGRPDHGPRQQEPPLQERLRPSGGEPDGDVPGWALPEDPE